MFASSTCDASTQQRSRSRLGCATMNSVRLFFAVCIISVTCGISAPAIACRGPDFERTIFFDRVPTDLGTEIIVRVTITKLIGTAKGSVFTRSNDERYSFIGLAHIDKIFRGVIVGDVIKVRAPNLSCDHPFSVGLKGIVAGRLSSDDTGAVELLAISESGIARRKRERLR
jgi:hypothetical protein